MKFSLKGFVCVLLFLVTMLFLVSCAGKQKDTLNTDDCIYSPSVDAVLVVGDGIEPKWVEQIKSAYKGVTGKEISVSDSESTSSAHEIVIGKANRDISNRAYRFLTYKLSEEEVGYAAYSDGKSVAIAFDDTIYGVDAALDEAVSYIVGSLLSSQTLKLESGLVNLVFFDPIEWQEAKDKINEDKLWSEKLAHTISKTGGDSLLSEEIIKSIKELHNIYTSRGSTVTWLANLYDPKSGGFYYSNSARNNIGYLPDLESTAHAIGIVEAILTGYQGNLTDYFGEEIASRFVWFAKGMQSADNGYFYHPQWTREMVDENRLRRERDLANALDILKSFGASPIYDTPNGVRGDGILSNVNQMSSCEITLPLSAGRAIAVSSIAVESGNLYIPAYLTTKEEFQNYLSSLDIVNNTYEVAETLASKVNLILTRDEMLEEQGEDYRFADVLVSWLSSYQKSATGLFVNKNKVSYGTIKNFCSVAKVYNGLGKTIPYADKAIVSILSHVRSGIEEIDEIHDIADTWSALTVLSTNLSACVSESEKAYAKSARDNLYLCLPEMLNLTTQNLSIFLKIDGSFSTQPNGSSGKSYGMPICVSSSDEGDVSATLLATKSIWLSVFNILGTRSVPIYNVADRMLFQKTLYDMGVIIKNEINEAEPVDFENDEAGAESTDAVLHFSSAGSAVVIRDEKSDSNVLKISSPKFTGGDDRIDFNTSSTAKNATCSILDADICVLSTTAAGTFARIALSPNLYMISMKREGNTIYFCETSSASGNNDYAHDLGVSVDVGEWFNLRVEYYLGTRESVRIKVFFNGECVAVTDNFYGSRKATDPTFQPASEYLFASVTAVSSLNVDLLVDNVTVDQSYKTYSPEIDNKGVLQRNIDTPTKNRITHTFDTIQSGSLPDGFTVTGNASGCRVVTDADNGKKLLVSTGADIMLPLNYRGPVTNSAVLEFELSVDTQSQAGAKYSITFDEFKYLDRSLIGLQLLVMEDNGSKYATFAESISGLLGPVYSNIRLVLGEVYQIKMHYFFDDAVMLLSINNEIAAVNHSALVGSQRCYMGEVNIKNLTSSVSSSLIIDNLTCERVTADYTSVTAPTVDRETHTFESFENFDRSGVSLVEDAVSFESATSGAYLKIPVNVRSAVASLGYVSLDVTNLHSKNGDLIISLVDKEGEKISAFALSPAADGVAIYEYTENGKYNKPLCLVNKDKFTLAIEYSPFKQSFNLLADGSYIASTSVIFDSDNGAVDFDCIVFETVLASGFLIDNLVAETSGGLFAAPVYSMANPDDSSAAMTYESSSFADIPKPITLSLGAATSAIRVRESKISGKVTRVLEIYSGLDATYSDYVSITQTSPAINFNAIAFETDIMMMAPESSALTLAIEPRSHDARACYLSLRAGNDGTEILAKGMSSEFSEYIGVMPGEWFKLRMEYASTLYDYNYDGSPDIIQRVYVNGKLIAQGHTPYYPDRIQASASIFQIRLGISGKFSGSVCLDNTVFEQFTMKYDKPLTADTDVLTYEPGVVTGKTQATIKSSSGSIKIVDMTIENQVGKVLKFSTASGGIDTLKISPTLTDDTANAAVFETDLMLDPHSSKAQFFIDPVTAGNNSAFRLMINADAYGNVTLASNDIAETVIGKIGMWIHIRIEFMNPRIDYNGDKLRDLLYKVYVDGSDIPIAIGYNPYSPGNYYSPSQITHYSIQTLTDTSADIYLDNTMFWQVNMTPDPAPTTSEDSKLPVGREDDKYLFDSNAWA